MGTNFYKLNKSLGKFRALRTNGIENSGYYAEISDNGMDQYNDGSFNANIYTDGKLDDIEINGWVFSFHIEGNYHLPGSYKSLSFYIEAIDPEGTETRIYNTPYYSYFREGEVLSSFLDLINIYCNFQSADEAQKYYKLLRSIEGKQYSTCRSFDSDIITPEVGMAQAKYFKDYYECNKEMKDRSFLKKIKETVNCAVEEFKNKADLLKIE